MMSDTEPIDCDADDPVLFMSEKEMWGPLEYTSGSREKKIENELVGELLDEILEDQEFRSKMQHPNFLISIDPGIVNLACCFASEVTDVEKGTCVITWYADKMSVSKVNDPATPICIPALVQKINSWVEQHFATNWELGRLGPVSVYIEQQYVNLKNKAAITKNTIHLQIIQAMLATIFEAKHQCPVFMVHSNSYRQALGLIRGDHYENKKASLEFCRNLLSKHDFETYIKENDHLADCLNQVYYMRKKELECVFQKDFKIKMVIVPEWQIDFSLAKY
jgi:hypothetical protein